MKLHTSLIAFGILIASTATIAQTTSNASGSGKKSTMFNPFPDSQPTQSTTGNRQSSTNNTSNYPHPPIIKCPKPGSHGTAGNADCQ